VPAGIDLNPLDVTDEEEDAWLRCLIWPGEPECDVRLTAAVAVEHQDPPSIIRGDLVDYLAALASVRVADISPRQPRIHTYIWLAPANDAFSGVDGST